MRIGAHVTIAGGLPSAIKKAKSIGAECIQIFLAPPQMWKVPDRDPEEIEQFNLLRQQAKIDPVFIHSIYLINLASDKNTVFWGSVGSLVKSMELAEKIKAVGVIFHIGSSKEKTFKDVESIVIKGIKEILEKAPKDVNLIIENSAGAGNLIGDSLDEIGEVIKKSGADLRLKVCLDTQHMFASGYDDRTKAGIDKLFKEFDQKIGLERLVAIHANDSKTDMGSNVDRHENIGKGKIGLEGFRELMSHPAVAKLPFILETPGFEEAGPDEKNIQILKKIRKEISR